MTLKKLTCSFLITIILLVASAFINNAEAEEFHWMYNTFLDEFGKQSKSAYMHQDTVGTVSNMFALDGKCYVRVIISHNDFVGIFLNEYKMYRTPIYFPRGLLKMRNSKGEILELRYFSKWSQYGGLHIINGKYNFFDFMRRSVGDVHIMIHDDEYSTYRFTINANGFSESYMRLQNYHTLKQKGSE